MKTKFACVDDVADRSFDYIIIGGGVSGSVIACRLTENPETTVLLIEAGKGRIVDHAIDKSRNHPYWFNEQLGNLEYDWFFSTTPQEEVKGKNLIMSRGKGLGGSSNINFQVWVRPGPKDIAPWEKLGNPGWSYDDLAPYIQKVERFHTPSAENINAKALAEDQYWFGKDGPISIAISESSWTGLDEICRTTTVNRDIPFIRDPGLGEYMGYWSNASSINPETLHRFTAFKGYILPNLHRKNLTVLPEAYVTKLLIQAKHKPNSDETVTAEGVQFVVDGKSFVVHANKEVILCAGSLKTPQLLELSGIGNPDILEPLAIPILVNLPGVGENLQEHYIAIPLAYELRPNFQCSTLDILHDAKEFEKHKKIYEEKKNGLFSFTHSEVVYTSLQVLAPDISDELIARHEQELASRLSSLSEDSEKYKSLKAQSDIQLAWLKDPEIPEVELVFCPYISGFPNEAEPGKKYISIACGVLTALSKGAVHISSAGDPLLPPQIDLNTFDYPIELEILLQAFKWARKYIEYEPFKSAVVKEINPGDGAVTDEQIRDCLKETMFPYAHTTGTAAMLPRDKLGVVDPNLRVYGTSNIRVCDYSIAPIGVPVHPQSLAYAIAEKAADLIISDI